MQLRNILSFFTGHFIFQKHLLKLVKSGWHFGMSLYIEEDENGHQLLFGCLALQYKRTLLQALNEMTKTSSEKYNPEWYRFLINLTIMLKQLWLRNDDWTGEE